MELKGKPGIPEELKNVFKEVITKLVKADQLLVKVAIFDAKNTPTQNPKFQKMVEFQIKKAEEELIKAEKELSQNKPDKVVMRLSKAWLHAQLAIKFADFCKFYKR
jgi:ferredoxin-fold anticodon binding domain-containing protein